MPEVFARRDDQARSSILVQRAAADEIRTLPPELGARGLHQHHEIRVALDPLDFTVRDSGRQEDREGGSRRTESIERNGK